MLIINNYNNNRANNSACRSVC